MGKRKKKKEEEEEEEEEEGIEKQNVKKRQETEGSVTSQLLQKGSQVK